MELSTQMLVFAKVAEMKSISAASRASGQTPSALSKQIKHLEDHVGQRLLHRTKTGVTLTAEGRAFYERCRAVAEKFQEAEDFLATFDAHPKGELRVASSVAFGKSQLIPILPEFLARFPEISIALELTDRVVDIEAEDFDAAISFAEQETPPNLMTRKIMANERILCAAPAYLARHGTPASFGDLKDFNCLRISNATGRNEWKAVVDGREVTVDAKGNFSGNSADSIYRAALAGLGTARLSTYIVAGDIASGALVRVLPGYTQKHADIAVTFAEKRNLAPKTRAFVDFLAERARAHPIGGAGGSGRPGPGQTDTASSKAARDTAPRSPASRTRP